MAALVFNIAKGRVAELHNRVDSNDPAASTLVVMALRTANLESDAILRDKVTFADIVSGTTREVANVGYARQIITDTGLAFPGPDQVNDRMDLTLANFAFGAITAGDGWSKIVIGYDPSSTGVTSSLIIPLTLHDVAIVPDGSAITIQLNAAGYFRAA